LGRRVTMHRGISSLLLTVLVALAVTVLAQDDAASRAAAATLVKDINPGVGSSNIGSALSFNGLLIFTATDGTSGTELWKSDGTAAGTAMLKDINPGAGSSFPSNFVELNGVLVFSATDSSGTELWKTDGTAAGTGLLKDINPGAGSSNPALLSWYTGGAGFAARDDVYNGLAFFAADDGANGVELWKTDGTAGGTSLVMDINPGAASSSPMEMVLQNGKLLFLATQVSTGQELWITDGTAVGTALVKDINPGPTGSTIWFLANGPTHAPQALGFVWFAANDGVNGLEMWRSDGTAVGTTLVANVAPGAGVTNIGFFFTTLGSRVIYTEDDGTRGVEPYITDGTPAGTSLLKDINAAGGSWPDFIWIMTPQGLQASSTFNNVVLFNADDGLNGIELWKTDGTPGGTQIVKDINPGAPTSSPGGFFLLNGKLFFSATTATEGTELWSYDGTAASLFADLNPGAASASPAWMLYLSGGVLLTLNNGANGTELWTTDGTVAGTALLKDIEPGPTGSNPSPQLDPGRLIFTATTTTAGTEPWLTDGTATGTVLITDLEAGAGSSILGAFTPAGSRLFFTAQTLVLGSELYAINLADVADPPLIISSLNQGGTVGTPFKYEVKVQSNTHLNLAVTATGLPPGLVLDTRTHVISGTPTASGTYSVTLVADNGAGTDTKILKITIPGGGVSATSIDSDEDGFPDELETALGFDPNNPASGPFGGSKAGAPQPFTLAKLAVKLNFAKANSDQIAFSGTVPVGVDVNYAGQTFIIDVGGVVKSFTLDEKGKSPKGNDTVSVGKPGKTGSAKYSVKLNKGSFATTLADEGLTDETMKAQTKTVPVIVLFGSKLYSKDQGQVYTATKGKSGKTAMPKK
jgi:ELWxxDGT repeat protein